MPRETALIVGASLAGGRAAETLRQEGYEGRIILLGAEIQRPYDRPPLSKGVLRGEIAEEEIYLRPAEYYAEQEIELRLGTTATALRPAQRTVTMASGESLAYDKLLITTGVAVRPLAVPGANLGGVHYLRTLEDARAIRAAATGASRAVVIGAGFIGAEVAASLRSSGLEVTLLEILPVPLQRALGERVGGICGEIHRERGVGLRLSEGVSEFRGSERVEEVVTSSGAVIPTDLVVVGVGVRPNVDWLAGSGLAIENGILVDELSRSNLPDIFAAGDVANWWHPGLGERLRVEHYDNAQNQGVAAAKSMLGKGEPYAPVPYFWSDQYDLTLQYVGHAHGEDEIVFRGDIGARTFVAFYLREGAVRAALGINRLREVNATKRLIRDRVPVSREQLADEGLDLRRVGKAR